MKTPFGPGSNDPLASILQRVRHEIGGIADMSDISLGRYIIKALVHCDTEAIERKRWFARQTTQHCWEFPVLRFLPDEEMIDRDAWLERWMKGGGLFYDGEMYARNDNPVFYNISRFLCPWPPYCWGCASRLIPIARIEAHRLGVLKQEGEPAPIKLSPDAFAPGTFLEVLDGLIQHVPDLERRRLC